jgi:hypothetical protein
LIRFVVIGLSAFLLGGEGVAVVAIALTPLLSAVLRAARNSLLADLRLLTSTLQAHHSFGRPKGITRCRESPITITRRTSSSIRACGRCAGHATTSR